MKLHQTDTRLLLFVATALITLSHLDAFLPDPRIASGGAIGNSLFFFISGFGITHSLNAFAGSDSAQNFWGYFKRRLLRIYPSFMFLLALTLWARTIYRPGSFHWFESLVWPTPFWFITAITLFYVPLFWLAKLPIRQIMYFSAALLPAYVVLYLQLDLTQFTVEGDNFVKIINYFWVTIFGVIAAKAGINPRLSRLNVVALASSLFLFLLFKLFLFKLGLSSLQFLYHLTIFPIVYFCFHIFCSPAALNFLKHIPAQGFIFWAAGYTLEIYLVQGPWLSLLAHWNLEYRFPIPLLIGILPIPLYALGLRFIVTAVVDREVPSRASLLPFTQTGRQAK